MRFQVVCTIVGMALCGGASAGCAGAGASTETHGGAVPASAGAGVPAVHSGVRRPASTPACTGTGTNSFIGGGESNVAAGKDTVVAGGSQNFACDQAAAILGGSANSVDSTSFGGVIAGGANNSVSQSSEGTIAGGFDNTMNLASAGFLGAGISNQLSSNYAVLAGGDTNTSSHGDWSALVGGRQNQLTAIYGFVGAGTNNSVSGEGGGVMAGGYNVVSGEGAVVDGGFQQTASGNFATVPGGYRNTAAGTYSFAGGAFANAQQTGTFVWSDGSDGGTTLTSSRAYQFLARASGGFTLYTDAGSTAGAQLAAGSGTWASLSDRNAKTNVVPLDDETILAKVAALPISRWSYRTERGVRHVGPMAQDFYAAFNVGEDDRHITSIDEDGVALAAIKGLAARLDASTHREQRLREELAGLKAVQTRRDANVGAQLTELREEIAALRRR